MAKDLDNIRIYGDEDSAVFVAPLGTTGPTTLAAPGVGFEELGWLGEDGVPFDRNQDVTDFRAFQGGTIVRKKVTSDDHTFRVQCLEETALTLGLYYSGEAFVTTTGVAKATISPGAPADPRAWVVDLHDGAVHKRYVVPKGEVTERATVEHQNAALTIYDLTVTIYGDYDIYTNNPAVVTP